MSIDVVNLSFCSLDLPAEDKWDKKTLEELHTYAELKHDPRADLPDAFSVCSTIMATDCKPQWSTFLNILINNSDQFLVPSIFQGFVKSQIKLGFQETSHWLIGKTPLLFPNQWTRSCIAVN